MPRQNYNSAGAGATMCGQQVSMKPGQRTQRAAELLTYWHYSPYGIWLTDQHRKRERPARGLDFQTGRPAHSKTTPLVVDGIMYVTAPTVTRMRSMHAMAQAMDVQHTFPQAGRHGSQSRLRHSGRSIIHGHPDANVVALEAKTGS